MTATKGAGSQVLSCDQTLRPACEVALDVAQHGMDVRLGAGV
ncbi:MAG: hypothetical protein WCC30_16360 [Candidatus Dormiibacterota bacterium]